MNHEPNDIKQLLHDRGICVIIPTYNNCLTVRQVACDVLEYCKDVIVVNDGSTDSTMERLRDMADIVLIDYKDNKGKGHALKVGFRKALEMGFAYAITIDADGQHFAKDIPTFAEANIKHSGALLIGNRQLDGAERSKGSSFANKFSNFWFYLQTGHRLNDTQSGYRLYPLKKLRGLSLLTNRYEAELELLVFPSWHGVEIFSVPIDVYYPPKKERVSHFRPYKDFGRISILNTILCILAIVYGLPLRIWRALMTFVRTAYTFLVFVFFSNVIIAPFVWLYVRINKNMEQTTTFLHKLIYRVSRLVILWHGIPGTKFRYKTCDVSVFDTPHVVICNHQSHFDTMCQLILSPNIIFLTNDWVWNNPFYGLLIRNAEYLPVHDGIDSILPQLQNLVSRGYSVAVFPEGTRTKDGNIGRFHQGAFYIAEKLGIGVLPMFLYGTGRILPPRTYHLRKGIIYMSVCHALTREELCAMGSIREQAKQMHRWYTQKYNELKNRIDQYV